MPRHRNRLCHDELGEMSISGIYATGDCGNSSWHQVTEAIADGARIAAKGVNHSIVTDDLEAVLAPQN